MNWSIPIWYLLQPSYKFPRAGQWINYLTIMKMDFRSLFQFPSWWFPNFCSSVSITFTSRRLFVWKQVASRSQYLEYGLGAFRTSETSRLRAGGILELWLELLFIFGTPKAPPSFTFGHAVLKCPYSRQFQHGTVAACHPRRMVICSSLGNVGKMGQSSNPWFSSWQ